MDDDFDEDEDGEIVFVQRKTRRSGGKYGKKNLRNKSLFNKNKNDLAKNTVAAISNGSQFNYDNMLTVENIRSDMLNVNNLR